MLLTGVVSIALNLSGRLPRVLSADEGALRGWPGFISSAMGVRESGVGESCSPSCLLDHQCVVTKSQHVSDCTHEEMQKQTTEDQDFI